MPAVADTEPGDETTIDYCDYANHPGSGDVATWLAGAPEGANTDCIDVGTLTKACGVVDLPITNKVKPFDYWIEYSYTVDGQTFTGKMPQGGLKFEENYNRGSVDVQLFIGGPEQDWVAFANEDMWKYPGQTVKVDTACNVDYCNVSEYGPPVSSIGNWMKTAEKAPNCIVVGEASMPRCNSLDIEFTNLVKHDWKSDFQLAWAVGESIPADDAEWKYTWPIVNDTAKDLVVTVFVVGPESEMMIHDDGTIFVDEETAKYAYWYGGAGNGGVQHVVPVCDYCDPDTRPGGMSTAAWLASAPEGAKTACIAVDEPVIECGKISFGVDNDVVGYTYQIEYAELDEDGNETGAYVAVEDGVITFPEGYNDGSVTIRAYLGGPEQDYVTASNIGELQYPGHEYTITTACEAPPTEDPGEDDTEVPTDEPSDKPTDKPSDKPTEKPTTPAKPDLPKTGAAVGPLAAGAFALMALGGTGVALSVRARRMDA